MLADQRYLIENHNMNWLKVLLAMTLVTFTKVEASDLPTMSFDFGSASPGQIVSHTFTVTNTTQQPLDVKIAALSAGGSTKLSSSSIAPGKTIHVSSKFRVPHKEGDAENLITLQTNSSLEPLITLKLHGTVTTKKVAGHTPAEGTHLKPQYICPFRPVPIKSDLYYDHKGLRIYTCCAPCLEKVMDDPEAAIRALKAKGQYPIKAEDI